MNNITISYAVSAYNEHNELALLLESLYKVLTNDDEIVIVTDTTATQEVLDVIETYKIHNNIKHFTHSLNKNFAEHKNFINSCCSKRYIYNIDADESVAELLLEHLKSIIEDNPDVEVFRVPRINIVKGITQEYINANRWQLSIPQDIQSYSGIDDIIIEKENGLIEPIINFPDYQTRLYKNDKNIIWYGKVHETLTGYSTISNIPPIKDFCLYHFKTFDKQVKQNNFYTQL